MTDYKMIKEHENNLKIDKDLIEIQKTIVHYGKKIDEILSKLNRILEKEQKSPLVEKDTKKPDAFIEYLKRIK